MYISYIIIKLNSIYEDKIQSPFNLIVINIDFAIVWIKYAHILTFQMVLGSKSGIIFFIEALSYVKLFKTFLYSSFYSI